VALYVYSSANIAGAPPGKRHVCSYCRLAERDGAAGMACRSDVPPPWGIILMPLSRQPACVTCFITTFAEHAANAVSHLRDR